MNTREALDIKNALVTLSEALDLVFQDLASRICFCDKAKEAILIEASNKWNAFNDAPLVEGGAMLGINITVSDQNETTNTKL